MICPISPDNLDNLKDFVIERLEGTIKQEAPFSLKELMSSVYQDFGKTVPPDQALSFVQQVPSLIREFIKEDDIYFEKFSKNIGEIVDVQKQLDTDTPLKSTADYIRDTLGLPVRVIQQVNQQISGKAGFSTVASDELADALANSNKIKSEIAFNALARSVVSTTGNEVNAQGIPFSEKVQAYGFMRFVLNMIAKGEIIDSTDFPQVPGGIRLTAMAAYRLGPYKPQGVADNDPVMVITDDKGNILTFNNEFEVSEAGRPMAYGLRNVEKAERGFNITPPIMRAEDVVKKKNLEGDAVSLEAYRNSLKENVELMVAIRNHIRNNPDAMVMTVIDGGSNGYIPYDEATTTPLSTIDFSDDPLTIQFQKGPSGPFYEGATYFNVRGVSNPILLSRKVMSRDIVEKIASTLVDPIFDRNTNNEEYEISNIKKLELVGQYRANTNVFSVGINDATNNIVVQMMDKSFEITPENKEKVRAEIIRFFTVPLATKLRATDNISNAIDGTKPGFNPSTLRQGAIVRFGTSSNPEYYKYFIPEITINDSLLRVPDTFNNYSLEATGTGAYRIINRIGNTNGGMDYMKFIKENTFVKYKTSPGDNKLRQVNAYFTFQVPEDQKRKVIPVVEDLSQTSIVTVYQGYKGKLEDREFNYYTISKEEAQDYGPNVREVQIDTTGALDIVSNRDLYRDLKQEFKELTGNNFDILLNNEEGLKIQSEFFKFLKSKGYTGLNMLKQSDSRYFISFTQKPITPETKPTKSAEQQYIEDLKNGLFKTTVVKMGEVVATSEQKAAAKAWFQNSPLSQHIGFQELFNAVNSEAVAEFFNGAIVLYAGADYSDIYHEAWHAFSQMYMTVEQKTKLYNELGKKSGSFTTNTGKRISFANATYQELEEYLAEDFREYMLSDGKTYNGPVRNSIFRKILDFLKALFGDTTIQQMVIDQSTNGLVQEIFEKLRVGNLTGYTFSASNVMFGKLNKGAEAISPEDPVQALSPNDSIEARKTIDSIFSSFLDAANASKERQYTAYVFRTVKGRMTAYSAALTRLKERRLELLKEIGNTPEGLREENLTILNAYVQSRYPLQTNVSYTDTKGELVTGEVTGYLTDTETGKLTHIRVNNNNVPLSEITDSKLKTGQKRLEENEINAINRNLELLNWMINNYGDPMDIKTYGEGAKGLIAYHNKKSEFLSFEDRGTEDAADNNVPQGFKLVGNETSVYETAKVEVLYMLRGLKKTQRKIVNGKEENVPVLNRLGFEELMDLPPVINRLSKILEGSDSPQQMSERLEKAVKEIGNKFYYLNQLRFKLGDVSNPDPMVQDMWGAFWQTFNRYFINQPIVFMDRKKGVYETRTGSSYGDKNTLTYTWDTAFSTASTGSPFIKRERSKAATLDIKALLKEYPSIKTIQDNKVKFLLDIGIPIDVNNPDMLGEFYSNDTFKYFSKYMFERLKLINEKGIEIEKVSQLFLQPIMVDGKPKRENTIYSNLQELFVKYNDAYSDASLTTPNGDLVYALSLNSSATAVAKGLNNAMLFSRDVLSGHLSYLDTSRNPWAKRSKSIISMFDPANGYARRMKGRVPAVEYLIDNVAGLTVLEEGDNVDLGVNRSSADETAALMMDLAYFLQSGIIGNPTPGEKSTRLSTRVSRYQSPYSKTGRVWMDIDRFSKANAPALTTDIYQSIVPYLFAEVDRIAIMRMAEKDPSMIENDFDVYKENGKNFHMFDKMISESTKTAIMDLLEQEGFNGDKLEAFLNSNTEEGLELRANISRDLMSFWQKEFDKNLAVYAKGGRITDDVLGKVIKDSPNLRAYINFASVTSSREELTTAIIKAFTFNVFIHNTEATILNYGDPAQYATKVEFHKRIQMFSSSGEIFRTDGAMMSTLNQMLSGGYAKSLGIDFKAGGFTNVLNTAIMEDPKLTSIYFKTIEKGLRDDIKKSWSRRTDKEYTEKTKEQKKELIDAEVERQVKAYKNMKIADAQGWITFDSYRLLSKAMNDWSPAQEALFQDIVNGKDVDLQEVIKYFPVMKYQYAGALATTSGLPVMAGHKFSLMPLIPNVIKDSPNLVALHTKMMKSNVDYATMKSGSKITTITHAGKMDKFFKDNNLEKREFDADLNEDGTYKNPFMPNKVYMEFLKKQQPTNTEYKESSIFATQMRKVIEEGLVEGGIPSDFMADEKDLNERIKRWKSASEDERSTPKYKLYMAYEKALSDLTNKKKERLLKDIGWDTAEKYGKVNTKLIEFLKKEMRRQDVSDHEMSYLDIMYNGALKYSDLSIHLSQELIEKVILSIVNRNLIRQKINGEPLIQVSGLGWENMSQWKPKYNLTNPTKEQLDKFGTNGLTYYQPGKGPNGTTSAMTIKIALQGDFKKLLNHTHKDGSAIGTLARLNEMVKDEQWLNTGNNRKMITMVAVRIPVQGHNSMEVMQVAEFLPENAGNMIILPAEIVAKSGSDFDIDKLSVYMPNIRSTKDGIVSLDEGNTEGGAENRLLDSMVDIITSPDNYASLVRPNDTYTLDPIVNDTDTGIREYVTDYSPKIEADGTKLEEISGSDLMQYRYNLYVHVVNKVAQEALGIAAVDNTFNILFNRVGARMNSSYLDGTKKQLAVNTGVEKEITLFMDHNTLVDENGQKVISLSHMYDALGVNKISDNISQAINLLLEIAKNDSAFYLQLNKETIPTLLFLNQAGVPIKQAVYFAAHPVIREYMDEIRKARTPVSDLIGTTAQGDRNYFVSAARKRIMQKYNLIGKGPGQMNLGPNDNPKGPEAHKSMYDRMMLLARNEDGTQSEIAQNAFNANNLLNDIKTSKSKGYQVELTPEEELILLHWFHIEDFSKPIKDIKMRLNFDTSRTKSAFMASNKVATINSLMADKRIPSSIVKDILEYSPISSLYLVEESGNPLTMDLLQPLLPLRANGTINSFLNRKLSSYADMQEIEDIFGNVDRFVNRFMNDLTLSIAQKKLRSFNITTIKKYRNINTGETIDIEKVPYLKFGAFVQDGVMYIDTKQLIKDFQEANYLAPGSLPILSTDNYTKRGLAPIESIAVGQATFPDAVFSTPDEYFNFVLEREYIRHYTKLDDALRNDYHFKKLRSSSVMGTARIEGEEIDAYNIRIDRMAYEQWIRDRALDSIGNGWKLFYSNDSYAKQVDRALNQYDLREKEPLLKNVIFDEKPTEKGTIYSLRLLDYNLTSEKIDAYHKIISDLANPAVRKTDKDNKYLSDSENKKLSDLFARMPMVAFLQSGLNTSGPYSLIRLVPANNIMNFLAGSVADYVKTVTPKTLDAFYTDFKSKNKDYIASRRYKNYSRGILPVNPKDRLMSTLYGFKKVKDGVMIYGVNPFYGLYDTSELNIKSAAITATAYPDRIFIYESATVETNPQVGSSGYFAPEKSKASNVIGIPSVRRFGKNESDALSDDTLKENMLGIEKAIQKIKVEARTKRLTFSSLGYGQSMLKTAPLTFMYLSQRLFEEFNYINPNYDGMQMIEQAAPIERDKSNITDVDLTAYLSERKAKLGKWKKDTEVMNNSQAAIGYPLTPQDTYESSSVAYAKALNAKGVKTGIQYFTDVKAVWVFGNLSGQGGITDAMLKKHFDLMYRPRIDEAIESGVEIFNLGDAKSGIDVMAAEYLKTLGFRRVKHAEWSSWTRQPEAPIGELTFSSEMLGKIKSGKKTIMSGNMDLTPGIYKLPDGSMIRVATPIIFKTLKDVSATANKAEGWAKAEGYDSFADLKNNTPSQFIKDFIALKADNLRVYALSKVEAPLTEREKAIAEANKRIDEESYLLIENDDIYQEFNSYEDLLFAYENGEIAPELVEAAYQELRSVNLLKYLNYNPNQLSLNFPSRSVINGEILDPSQVLASKSVANDRSVMDQIMRCITGGI